MEVKRIKTEGPRMDATRNVERLWLEVEAVGGGCSVEGHRVLGETRNDDGTLTRQPTLIEIYVDRLPAVIARTRTDKERRVWQQACESAQMLIDEWKRENAKVIASKRSQEERDRYVYLHCNVHASQQLAQFGYRTGLPPLDSCKVVHPENTSRTMDVREWQKLPADQRAEWLVDAPITAQNATQRAHEGLTGAFRDGMRELIAEMMRERQQPQKQK